ncbi:MAG TPA: MFS transporter [Limnochordales bacterium]
MEAQTARWVGILAAVPFVMVLGNSMLVPVLPTLQARLDLSPLETSLILTAFSLPAGLTIPLAGALSDRVGRKAVMVPALVLYGLGGALAGLASWAWPERPWALLVGRAVQGVGAGGTYQLAMALAGDIFQSRERSKVLGLLEAANGLGKAVSPLVGGLAAAVLWFSPFFVYGVLALPVAAAIALGVPQPGRQATAADGQGRKGGGYGQQLREVFARRGWPLAVAYAAGLVTLLVLFGLLSRASDQMEQRWRMREAQRGLLVALPTSLMGLCAYLVGAGLQRRPQAAPKASAAGFTLLAASVPAAILLAGEGGPLGPWSSGRGPGWLVGALCLGGLGVGLVLPALNLAVTGAASRSQRGLVTALYGTVRFVGAATGPPLFAAAASGAARWGLAAGTVATGLALAWGCGKVLRAAWGEPGRSRGEGAGGRGAGAEAGLASQHPEPDMPWV